MGSCTSTSKIINIKPFLTNIEKWPEIYSKNFGLIDSFYGKARLTIESERYSGHLRLQTFWEESEKLYLKAEGPFGLDLAQVFIGSSRFIFYDQHSNHFTAGSIHDPYLNRFWQTHITLQELKYSLLGQAIQPSNVLLLKDKINGIFSVQKDDIEYRYLVNPKSGLLENCELLRNSRVFMRQDFKQYQEISGIYIPFMISITLPDQKERISIFYKDIQLNKPINIKEHTIKISTKVQQLNLNE